LKTFQILLSLPGEAHLEVVESLLSEALKFYKDRLSLHDTIFLPKTFNLNDTVTELNTELKFPGKVAIDKTGTATLFVLTIYQYCSLLVFNYFMYYLA